MKTRIILTVFLVLVSINKISSQNEMRIGVNAGVNASQFKGFSYVEDMTVIKPGFLIGAYFEYYLDDNWSLKANLNYERKSYKDKESGILIDENDQIIDEFKNVVHYNFISLPILAKYDIGQSNKFYANAGPNFNYRLNTIVKTDGFLSGKSTLTTNQLDLALLVGFGMKFHLNDINDLNLELRYSNDILNLSKEKTVEDPIQANTLSLVVSWNLEL